MRWAIETWNNKSSRIKHLKGSNNKPITNNNNNNSNKKVNKKKLINGKPIKVQLLVEDPLRSQVLVWLLHTPMELRGSLVSQVMVRLENEKILEPYMMIMNWLPYVVLSLIEHLNNFKARCQIYSKTIVLNTGYP